MYGCKKNIELYILMNYDKIILYYSDNFLYKKFEVRIYLKI